MLGNLLRAVVDRVKGLILMTAANEIEADAAAKSIEHVAELHRLAKKYETEGLPELAQDLRNKARAIDASKPLASVVSGSDYLVGDDGKLALTASAESPQTPALPAAAQSAVEKPKRVRKA